jgi:rubrerythrin
MAKNDPSTLLALSAGIQSEIAAYVFYLEAIKKVKNRELEEILTKLAYEEKAHFHTLERQHHSRIKSEKWVSIADIMKRDGLPEIAEAMAADHQELIKLVRDSSSIREVLDIAFKLEEDSHVLFSREADRADTEEARKIFTDLARFEKGHMGIVQDMIRKFA